MSTSKRIAIIDYLKAFSIIMVICTHYGWDNDRFPLYVFVIIPAVPIFLMLSGYNSAMSFSRYPSDHLRDLYNPRKLYQKLNTIFVPYTFLYLADVLLRKQLLIFKDPGQLLYTFLSGGIKGGLHGGYFFCVFWQFILLAPLLYLLIKKLPKTGLWLAAIFTVAFNSISHYYGLPKDITRILIFRYIFIICCGFWFYQNKNRLNKVYTVLLGIYSAFSIWFLIATQYFDYHFPLKCYWPKTSIYANGYHILIVFVCFYLFANKTIPGKFGNFCTQLGRSTFHIFLFQMLYYRVNWDDAWFGALPMMAKLTMNVIVCVAIGMLWYYFETAVRRHIKSRRQPK